MVTAGDGGGEAPAPRDEAAAGKFVLRRGSAAPPEKEARRRGLAAELEDEGAGEETWRRAADGPRGPASGLAAPRGLFGPSVNRWSIKRSPNGTKLDRRSTGSIQGRLASLGTIRERLTPAHEKRQKGTPEDIGAP